MRFLSTALLLTLATSGFAQAKKPVKPAPKPAGATGYAITVTLKPFKNQYIYLGHYYGKQLPIIDSVKLDANSTGTFRGSKPLGGGIYLIGWPDRAHNFEFLVDRNQKFSILADTLKMDAVQFVGSKDNTDFKAYQGFMARYGRSLDSLYRLRKGAPEADSLRLNGEIEAANKKIRDYRENLIKTQPNSFLTTLLKAMKEPDVPMNDPRAQTDSQFAYKYFKKHYWDDVRFYDERLARTPFLEPRIDKYMEQLVYPHADSVNKELDYMLSYASINEEMTKFLLLKFVNRYLNQKYMWEDAVFVHLYNRYFQGKKYPWLTEKGVKVITDRAYSLMANIMGQPAADIDLPDTAGKKTTLYGLAGDYTLVTIWDPTCSHCKEVVPALDSAFQAKWKGLGLKMFALARETEGKKSDWMDFIHKHKLSGWTHVYYSKADDEARVNSGIPSYSQLYDVQSFPTLFLLDKDKKIIAKKVTLEQVEEILTHLVKKS